MDDLYAIKRWGEGYFKINALGDVSVHPQKEANGGDLFELMQSLVAQGIEPPILIRFNGIIRDRIHILHKAFQAAIADLNYRNQHQMMFPIKVNPHRHVVEVVHQAGQAFGMGLEVGSKPELLAVLAMESNPETLLLCNGYKDADYISLALMSRKLGRNTIITIEQSYELKMILDLSEKLGVEPVIGLRMKLSNKGAGRWQGSGGEHAKFGLFSHEIVDCVDQAKKRGKLDCIKLLHFHLGSQITSIESIKRTLREGARMYTELASLLPNLTIFDVGGGLAVDYDGSKTFSDASMNYSVEEYTHDVVAIIGQACLAAGVVDPLIVTESGRAIVSYHSVLITEVIDVTSKSNGDKEETVGFSELATTLQVIGEKLTVKNSRGCFHDLLDIKERIIEEFTYGKIDLRERARVEKQLHSLLIQVQALFKQLAVKPDELPALDALLKETYFCNLSVFKSLPDSWGIGHLFPVMPIHRLNDPATHQGFIADLTCDSDGKIDHFIEEPKNTLKLHTYNGDPYYLGVFLVGAYQEILGGLHNLFGDTNVVHAEWHEGTWELSRLVEGDTIEEVLHHVQYNTESLLLQLHASIERSLKAGRISLAESAVIKKQFKQALESYTYLMV